MQGSAETRDRTAGEHNRTHDRHDAAPVLGVGLTALLAVLLLIFVIAIFYPPHHAFQGLAAYLPLHTAMETFAIVVSMLVFTVGWNAHSEERAGNIVLLSCAFLAVGLLDFAHVLSYPGMADFVTPSGPEKAINFWLAARGLAALALLAAAVLPCRPFAARGTRYWLLAASMGITALAYWVCLFQQDELPATFIAGRGLTPFKIGAEYALIALYGLAAAVFFARLRVQRVDYLRQLFVASCVIALSELFFTLYGDVTDSYNLLGHVYKVIAFFLIYQALFGYSLEEPYRQLQLSRQAVRENQERFRNLASVSSDWYWEQDAEYRFTFMSGGVQGIGKRRWELPMTGVSAADWEQHKLTLEQHLPFHDFVYQTSGEAGRLCWLSISGVPVFDSEGNFQGYRGTCKDITERKLAEAALRESEERLSSIVESAIHAIIMVDEDMNIVLFNPAAEEIFGYQRADMAGAKLDRLIPARFRHAHGRHISAFGASTAVARRMSERGIIKGLRANGEEFSAEASISRLTLNGKKLYTVILADITERERAEAERAQLAAIVEHSSDAIIGRALDGRITSWNAAAERLYGYTADEAIGRDLKMTPPEVEHEITLNRGLLSNGKPVATYETVRVTRDGRRVDVSRSMSAIKDSSGNVIGMAAIVRDISALKQAERELRRKTELAHLLEALARAANEAATPEAAMQVCLERICGYGGWILGRVGIFAPGQSMRVPQSSLWQGPQPARFDEFMRISNTFDHTPPSGRFTNIALREKRPVWVSDFSAAHGFGRMASAEKHGIRSGFVFPVVFGGEALAFLEFFADEVREPDAAFLEVLESVAGLLARVIERERARKALHESEQQMRLVTEHTPAMIAYFDAALICRFANSAFCRFHHVDPRDVPGMSLRDITGEHTYRVIGPTIARVREGKPVTMRRQEHTASGEIRHIEIHRVPDMSPAGAFRGYYAMLLDVTAQVQAEEARANLAAIVENSNDAIIGRALDGTITSWNAGAEQVYGYTKAETIGRNAVMLSPPELRDRFETNKKLLRDGGARPPYESINLAKDGRRIPISASLFPIYDAEGKVTGCAAIVRDISERKRAEQDILKLNAELEQRVVERTRQLAATNKELEAFSYSVSHDLRAPLRGIDGFSQMLLKKYAGELDETGNDYLQRIRRASVRMGELIDDLLQLSRVSRSQIRTEPVDLSRLARTILAELQEREPERKVVTEVQDGIEAGADPRLLRIALENLLGNAWKFTGKNSAAKIRFDARQQDGELIVSVKDNGAGFNMKYAHKLFGAFQRLHGAAEFEGTGIGLATVQRIIHLHGGRVWADATMDKGATFYFAMPRATRNGGTTTQQGEAA